MQPAVRSNGKACDEMVTMYGRPVMSQEWSVHAQLTISHHHPTEAPTPAPTPAPADPGGVHMEYSWGGHPTSPPPPPPTPAPNIPARPCYGFQRGNILFTTRPPPRDPPAAAAPPRLDSGYSSEHVSPGSYASLPTRKPAQPYSRRCKSTCSIVLSGGETSGVASASMRADGEGTCYHKQTRPRSSDFAPQPESCEVCGGGRSPSAMRRASGANTFTTHFCTRTSDPPAGKTTPRPYGSARRKTDSDLQLLQPDPEPKPAKRLSRSPARLRGRSPMLRKSGDAEGQRKPRTVHIDVYCTGSEDADASASSDDSDDASSPQTVFESEKLKVVHSRVGRDRLPAGYLRRQQQASRRSESFKHEAPRAAQEQQAARGCDSDDGLSSHYPSQSSTAAWSTSSVSSWKDTCSGASLAQSDSFEYADAADRLRIREKERAWGDDSKSWRSPETERRHMLQQQKFKEFLEKHLGKDALPLWKTETTEDSDDETGDAWSFCTGETPGKTLKREDTVKRVASGKSSNEAASLRPPPHDTGSLSDSGPHRFVRRSAIGPFGSKSPSPPPSKVATSVTSPFTNIPGKRTDQLSKAEKFGTIVGAFRKPGHHVGPSKNKECACEHCRKFYEENGYRTRTRSVGDMPVGGVRGSWHGAHESDIDSSSIASTDNEKSVRRHIDSGEEDDG
ncbi:hypothetical protein ANN_21609 [Periplaneta americana]|uniref:Uncharacterized protein n=1 Tax=Periplaneta americana TaxID=6978 RepID=A0ABQ8S6F4_PERAM|nr:hypothetical protein ANN_21609 [Periplaneta americana]